MGHAITIQGLHEQYRDLTINVKIYILSQSDIILSVWHSHIISFSSCAILLYSFSWKKIKKTICPKSQDQNHGLKTMSPKPWCRLLEKSQKSLFYFIWLDYDRLYTYSFLWKKIEEFRGEGTGWKMPTARNYSYGRLYIQLS